MEDAVSHDKIRIRGLDTLRGLAILLVIFGHFLPDIFKNFYAGFISSWGGGGVLLFFYLSGFLIFRNVQGQPPGIFLMRRFFKLFPAYWINIAVIIMIAIFLNGDISDLKTVLSNLLMVQEITHSKLLNNVYWTLQIEVKFYIVIVVFHTLFGARWIYALLAALLLINTDAYATMARGSTLITYLIAFFPGVAAARGLDRNWDKTAFREMAIISLLVAGNLFIFLTDGKIYQASYAIIFAGLLTFILNRDFSLRLFSFFGKISYSHYLYHTAIGFMLIAAMTGDTFAEKFIALVFAVLVTTAIATLSFYGVEKPAIMLGHRLEKFWMDSNSRLARRFFQK